MGQPELIKSAEPEGLLWAQWRAMVEAVVEKPATPFSILWEERTMNAGAISTSGVGQDHD